MSHQYNCSINELTAWFEGYIKYLPEALKDGKLKAIKISNNLYFDDTDLEPLFQTFESSPAQFPKDDAWQKDIYTVFNKIHIEFEALQRKSAYAINDQTVRDSK